MAATSRVVLAVMCLFAAPCLSSAAKVDVTPLQKVIQMMDDMLAKGANEKHEEAVEFTKFQSWCDGTRDAATVSIKEAIKRISELTASTAKNKADAETLAEEIADLDSEVAKLEAEEQAATSIRDKENADYKATHKDFSESIDAIGRAVGVLKQKTGDVPQSLLQVRNLNSIPDEAKATIQSFLALQTGEESDEAAPEANAYEFQSGGVVAMLEKLLEKFQDQKLDLEKTEMSAVAEYQTLFQQLTDNIKADKISINKKTAMKAQCLGDAADQEGDLSLTQATKAEDEKELEETNSECLAKSEEYEKNQVLRAQEIQVITKAKGILASGSVSGNADKHLPAALIQRSAKHSTALAQLRREMDDPSTRHKVIEFLQSRARALNSHYLSMVAVRAAADPFAKVKTMIKDLIVKLMEEANSEADQKAYCDTELATNKQTREIKTTEVDDLTALIEEKTALVSQLTEEIAELADEMASLKARQSEATNLRQEQSKENAKIVADAQEATEAVERALGMLKEFYGNLPSFIQGKESLSQEMAQAAKAPYKGMAAEGGGVLGFLEVILSDFVRLETETTSAESEAASQFKHFMDESTQDHAVQGTEKEHKVDKKQTTEEDIRSAKKELALTQQELDAALDYYDKLKPDCVDQGLSYEDRKAAREAEIKSLQEALTILGQENLG